MAKNNQTDKKPLILIVCNYYLPGFKSGGGLRSLVHMVERFKDRFDFRIITRDHDGDKVPYTTVKINEWNDVEGAKVYYLSKNNIKLAKLRELISEVNPDSIYVNSVFSTLTIFVLILRKLKLIPKTNTILAPEGEISDGALRLKAAKKSAFIKFAKKIGLYENLIWKTTAEPEKQEAERFKGDGGEIFIAPNLSPRNLLQDYRQELKPKKCSGEARMIFLSRFMRKKNFGWLIENIKDIEGTLFIDIIGPIEDETYWNETQTFINNLPGNIKVEYKGEIAFEQVLEKMFEYQFFILPTLGENFGHVFVEALAAGCPIILSDRTPWVELENKKIGWDIPLENPDKWNEVLNRCIKMDELSYSQYSRNAREFASKWLANPENEESTLTVLNYSLKT